jgi:hypothetical protein
MFEHYKEPLLPQTKFIARLAANAVAGIIITVMTLAIGMVGYHNLEHMSWTDSFANAAMILSGMGPLTSLQTQPGKIFAGVYALFSGLILIVIIGVIFAPLVHRFLHRFHLQSE